MNRAKQTSAGLLGALLLLACAGCYDLVGSGAADVSPDGLGAEGEAAYRLLAETYSFGSLVAGFGSTPAEVSAFAVLYGEPEETRDGAFEHLLQHGTLAGQLYGLSGLYLTDRARYEAAVPRYRSERRKVGVHNGCFPPSSVKASEAVKSIEAGFPLQMLRAGGAASVEG